MFRLHLPRLHDSVRARRAATCATSCAFASLALAAATPAVAQTSANDRLAQYAGLDCSVYSGGGAGAVQEARYFVSYETTTTPAQTTREPYVHPPLPEGVVADNLPPVVVNDAGIFDGAERYVRILDNDVSDIPFDLSTLHFVIPSREAGTTDGGVNLTIPGEGTWSLDTSIGDARFTPAAGFTGAPTPQAYQIADERLVYSETALIMLEDKHPPILNADPGSFTGEAVETDVLANDVASDGVAAGSLQLADADGALGAAVATADGSWTVTDTGLVRYVPAERFTGKPAEVSYTAADALGNVAEPLAVVLADAAAPVLDPVGGSFVGTAASVSAYGSDARGELPSQSEVQFVGAGGASLASVDVTNEGTWTREESSVTFSPVVGFTDAPTPQQLRVVDAAGNVSNEVSVTLADLAPPAVADDNLISNQGGAVTVDVVANDGLNARRFADSLAFICAPDGATISADGLSMDVAGAGQWTVAGGGLRFTPADGYVGGTDLKARYGLADALGNAAAGEVTLRYADGVIAPPAEPPVTDPGEPRPPASPARLASLIAIISLTLDDD